MTNYRCSLPGVFAATPPVGTIASAVLVDFGAATGFSAPTASPTNRSCTGLDVSSATGTAELSIRGSTSAMASVVTRLVSRNSAGDNSCRSSHGGTLRAQRQQVARTAHVEGVFGKAADVALHDHQIVRTVTRSLGVIGAVAHPDLMHPDMRGLGHVAGLAGEQQEYAHQLAIGVGHDAGTIALRGVGLNADADGCPCAEAAPASSERDGVIDRAAAGIQHDGRACSWRPRANSSKSFGLSAVTMPTALTQPRQLGWQATQLKPHRHFALFERDAGLRRSAERRRQRRQCDAKGGGAEQRPAAKIERPHEPQVGSFPQARKTEQWQWPRFNAR